MSSKCNWLDYTCCILVLIGALNWGLVGLLGFNFVIYLFGANAMVVKGIYVAIGLAGLYGCYGLNKCGK